MLWNAKLLHNHLKRCVVIGGSSDHRNNAGDNPGAAAACSKAALTRHCPQSGRGFVAARFMNSLAHPGCHAFPPTEVGSPGNLGRGWAILKAGFTLLSRKTFSCSNSITRQAHGLFQKSSAHENPAAPVLVA
jgi:hypothetical protein